MRRQTRKNEFDDNRSSSRTIDNTGKQRWRQQCFRIDISQRHYLSRHCSSHRFFSHMLCEKCQRSDPHDENYETFIMVSIIKRPIIIDAVDALQPGSSIKAQTSVNDKRQMMPLTSRAVILAPTNPAKSMLVIEIPIEDLWLFNQHKQIAKHRNSFTVDSTLNFQTDKRWRDSKWRVWDNFILSIRDSTVLVAINNCSFYSHASTVISCDRFGRAQRRWQKTC